MAKKNIDTIEHIKTKYSIKGGAICSKCPFKLYTKNDTVSFGIGNIYSNFIFILPSYDINAKIGYNTILSILQEQYKEITNEELFEKVYVTRIVKCYENTAYSIIDDSIKHCNIFLQYELSKLKAKNVVFFGNTYDYIVSLNNPTINTILHYKTSHKVYSPAVMYYDHYENQQTFIKQLKESIRNDF